MSQPEPRPQSQPQPPAQPKPRPERRASTQLTRRQRRGLLRLGDIVIPGDRDLPSFSCSGSADGIGLMLPHMYDADRSSLLALLTACAVLPKPLITLVVAAASALAPGCGPPHDPSIVYKKMTPEEFAKLPPEERETPEVMENMGALWKDPNDPANSGNAKRRR